jgi:hypothetical protein
MIFSVVSFRAGPGIQIEEAVDSRFRGNDKMQQFVFGNGISFAGFSVSWQPISS